jgi:Fic family protein
LPQEEVFRTEAAIQTTVSRDLARGRIRKLTTGIYTNNTTDPLERVAKRNVWRIAGLIFPGAVISDRTALEHAPASDGSVFLASTSRRDVFMPGLTLRSKKGPGPVEGDQPFMGSLHLASQARAYLENMAPSRTGKTVARRLARDEVERRLDADLRAKGEDYLNELREQARRVAVPLGLEEEARAFDGLVGTLLGTRDAHLVSDVAAARAAGQPYDPRRVELFEILRAELARTPATSRGDRDRDAEWSNIAFFDAYFSNFIEGTEFEVEEAAAIVHEGRIPRDRPEDAHDILGTFRVASDRREMTQTPKTAAELLSILRSRHERVMSARPDKSPGRFKELNNRAGGSTFVAPDLVEGTLARGFEAFSTLRDPFHRAAFMMFLVSEVHPFVDGNGRVARLMMNAELIAGGERRVIVPTIQRTDYLSSLKALSRGERPERYIRVLDRLQRYTAAIDFTDHARAEARLRETNAFMDAQEADLDGIRLQLPRDA